MSDFEERDIVRGDDGFDVGSASSPVPEATLTQKRDRRTDRKYELNPSKTYKDRWKEENRDHYLQKNREYVARFRAKQKGSSK